MTIGRGRFPDIVMYPSRDFFSADWRRFHSPGKIETLAREVKDRGSRILVVNRPIYPGVTNLQRPEKWRWWVGASQEIQELAENLFVVTPWVPIPDPAAHHIPGGTLVNRWILGRAVRRALRRLHFSNSLVAWLYHPYQLHYLGITGERLIVYEICDEEGVRGLTGRNETVARLERKLLIRADVVFTTARVLQEAKSKYRPDIYWFPNAADVKLFAKVQESETPIAEAVRSLPHPIIGYLGTIHQHTDIGLMKYVAERRPGWTIVMIGPEEDPAFSRSAVVTALRKLPNVHLLGYIRQEETPPYCKAFDVGIIPYRTDSRFNYYVNPLKLHEYTAMGKPVVTTRIPEVESHRDLIWIADTPEQFVAGIEEALRTDSPAKVEARLKRARENSWDVRVQGMLSIVQARLN